MAKSSWRFLTSVTGVIHVGAHNGEERDIYKQADVAVLWIEAMPDEFERLATNIAGYPRQIALNALLTDRDGETHNFNVSSNRGFSSSIFELAEHRDIWPNVTMIDSVALTSTTFATLITRNNIHLADYQALVLDVQGAELLVLRGIGARLGSFRFIKAEAADFEAYKGGATLDQLDAIVRPLGFREIGREVTGRHPRRGTYWDIVWERMSPQAARQHDLKRLLGPRLVSVIRRARRALRGKP